MLVRVWSNWTLFGSVCGSWTNSYPMTQQFHTEIWIYKNAHICKFCQKVCIRMYYSMAILHRQNIETTQTCTTWINILLHIIPQMEHYTAVKNELFLPTKTENETHKNIKQNKSNKNSASCMTPFISSSKTGKNKPAVFRSQDSGYPLWVRG